MPPAYEPGKYSFHVSNQGFGEAKTGTGYFFLEGTPRDNEHSYSRTIKLYISDKTAETVADKLKAIGWLGGKWTTLDPASRSFHSFIGLDIEAECTHEAGIGERSSELFEKWELPFAGAEREPLASNATVAGKLDKLFGKAAMPTKGKSAAKTDKPLETVAANSETDDIPF